MKRFFFGFIIFIFLTAFTTKVSAGWITDFVPPTTTITAKCGSSGSFTSSPLECSETVTVRITCSDTGSGCYQAYYTNDGGSGTCTIPNSASATYSTSYVEFSLTPDSGNTLICAGSSDHAGNIAESSAKFTITVAGPWYKLKNASLYKKGGIDLTIPSLISAFDGTGDDTTDRYLIINNTNNTAGVVSSNNTISYTSSSPFTSSARAWQNASYPFSSQSLISNFYEYVQARKEYKTITSLDDLVQDKINVINLSNLNLTNSSLSKSPVVLVVRNGSSYGNITVTENLTKANIAIIANTITFNNSVNSVEGIFIGKNIIVETTTGLKVKGNLISENKITIPTRTDTPTKPSIFVIFDPTQYINLLPLLSNSKYDYQQIQ